MEDLHVIMAAVVIIPGVILCGNGSAEVRHSCEMSLFPKNVELGLLLRIVT
jgi:hypothetical protein